MIKNQIIAVFIFLSITIIGCDNPTKPQIKGKKLTVSNTCKPLENKCEIVGEGIKLNLQFKAPASYQRLLPIMLESRNDALDEVLISLLIGGKEMPAEKMKSTGDKKHWNAQLMPFAEVTKDNLKIRLIVTYKKEQHYAEFLVVY